MAVAKEGLNKLNLDNVKPYDFTTQALGSCREVVRWMYAANPGDVSGVFTLENRYIVGKLSGIQDAGLMEITDAVKPRVEMIVRNEKKAKKIAEKYKGAASLDLIAQAEKQTIQHADSFSLGSMYIQSLGFEPAVQGYTFFKGFAPNTVSPGIMGNADGVYFVKVANKWSLPMDDINKNMMINQERTKQERQMQNLDQAMRAALIKQANVKYNAKNF
jgi:peptidyl-prolyl cis-trans isomerase D